MRCGRLRGHAACAYYRRRYASALPHMDTGDGSRHELSMMMTSLMPTSPALFFGPRKRLYEMAEAMVLMPPRLVVRCRYFISPRVALSPLQRCRARRVSARHFCRAAVLLLPPRSRRDEVDGRRRYYDIITIDTPLISLWRCRRRSHAGKIYAHDAYLNRPLATRLAASDAPS